VTSPQSMLFWSLTLSACSRCGRGHPDARTNADAAPRSGLAADPASTLHRMAAGASSSSSSPAFSSSSSSRRGAPATAADALGINEGVSIPVKWIQEGRVKPAQEPAMLAADAQQMVKVGAHVVRANTATYPWLSWDVFQREGSRWDRADQWVRAVTSAGLEPLMILGPWPGNRTAGSTDTYVPGDLSGYQRWIEAVVERYDGDGEDDMPGLVRPVKAWEVDNEPDLHNSAPPRDVTTHVDPATFETPAQYARVLIATGAAIRKADPTATILSAGIYRPQTPQGRAYLADVLRQPGAMDAFDVLSLHCYFDHEELGPVDRTLETWKSLAPDKGLWVTETSVPSAGPKSSLGEDGQARMVAAVIGGFLAGGAQRVLWHTLADPPAHSAASTHMGFSTNSLLRSPSEGSPLEEKPAGAVYRRMSGHFAGADPSTMVEVKAEGGRLLRVGDGWLAFWGDPVLPAGAGAVEDLMTGKSVSSGRTAHAPAWISPAR